MDPPVAGAASPRASGRPPGNSQPRLPRTVWLLGLASLLNDASSEAVFPLLGVFLATMGAPMRFVGLVLGLADALAVGIKVAVGALSDRVGRRRLVIGGYLVAALGRAGIALSGGPWQVLGARSLDRAGKAMRSGARDAMLTDAVHASDRGRAFGIHQALDHVGAAVGPLVAAGCLAAGLSLRATFAIAAALGLAAPLLLSLRLRESGGAMGGTVVNAPVPLPLREPESAASCDPQPSRTRFAAYLAVCGIFALGNSSDAFILLRATELGFAPAMLPLLWLLHHVVKSATTAIGGSLSDRIPRVYLIGGGWAAYALTYVGFAMASSRSHIVALLLFYALYHGLAEAPERALVADLAGPARRGFAFGLYYGVVGLAALPAGLLTGWLWDRAGAATAFAASAALAGAAAIALAVLVGFGPLRVVRAAAPSADR